MLGEIGIPICYGSQQALVTALSGPGLLTFRRDELQQMFSGGVLLDVSAWRALDTLGLSGWTGVTLGAERAKDAIEVLAEHPLSGRFAGWSRDCRQSFYHEVAHSLEPTCADVETLARMTDYAGTDLGCSMSAFTNELGGASSRWATFPGR